MKSELEVLFADERASQNWTQEVESRLLLVSSAHERRYRRGVRSRGNAATLQKWRDDHFREKRYQKMWVRQFA